MSSKVIGRERGIVKTVGTGMTHHATRVIFDNGGRGRWIPICGAGQKNFGSSKRRESHYFQMPDETPVTCAKCGSKHVEVIEQEQTPAPVIEQEQVQVQEQTPAPTLDFKTTLVQQIEMQQAAITAQLAEMYKQAAIIRMEQGYEAWKMHNDYIRELQSFEYNLITLRYNILSK